MLDALKKKLGIETTAPVTAPEAVQDVVEVALNVNTEGVSEALAALQADFATLQAAYTSLEAELATTKEALEAANVIVAEVEAAKNAALEQAKAAKLSARMAVVVATIGEARAAAFVAATENLEDAAFDAVASTLAGSMADEADTALFTEVGVDAQADATQLGSESPEMKILKSKYGIK